MKPDLDAIRAEHCNPNLIDAGARKAVRELLAYIDELERDILNERATFESCNRARRHCEDECAALKARTTYTIGETEWANRIAHAEQRFADEYDARKAAERQVEELKARDDETFDGTDAAHPAWWRGNDAGVRGAVNAMHRMLADAISDSGAFGSEELNDLHARIKSMLAEIAELKSRIVTLEAMR